MPAGELLYMYPLYPVNWLLGSIAALFTKISPREMGFDQSISAVFCGWDM